MSTSPAHPIASNKYPLPANTPTAAEHQTVEAGSVMVQSPFQANRGPQGNRERYSFKQ